MLKNRELADLCAAHREALNVREAYRINAVILLGRGYTAADVAEALLIDPDTARTYFKRYKKGGVEELLRMNHIGSEALLDEVQLSVLDAHLQEHLHETAESVARWGNHLLPLLKQAKNRWAKPFVSEIIRSQEPSAPTPNSWLAVGLGICSLANTT